MFAKAVAMYKSSEASAVVREVLLQVVPFEPFDMKVIPERLTALAYVSAEPIFLGKAGRRPHKITHAAMALAIGTRYTEFEFPHIAQDAMFLALGRVIMDADRNARRYGLTIMDLELIEIARQAYGSYGELRSLPPQPSRTLDQRLGDLELRLAERK